MAAVYFVVSVLTCECAISMRYGFASAQRHRGNSPACNNQLGLTMCIAAFAQTTQLHARACDDAESQVSTMRRCYLSIGASSVIMAGVSSSASGDSCDAPGSLIFLVETTHRSIRSTVLG